MILREDRIAYRRYYCSFHLLSTRLDKHVTYIRSSYMDVKIFHSFSRIVLNYLSLYHLNTKLYHRESLAKVSDWAVLF